MQQVAAELTKLLYLKLQFLMALRVMEMTLPWPRYFYPGPRVQVHYFRRPKVITLSMVLMIGLVFSIGMPKLQDYLSYSLKSVTLSLISAVIFLHGKKQQKLTWMP